MAGYRAGTRNKFRKAFKTNGVVKMSTYLKTYKIGEYVDIVVDGSVHKGMPHHYYHGRTGRIFSVQKRAIGVHLRKQVRGKYLDKFIYVKIEHIRLSKSRDHFVKRIKENDLLKAAANKNGQRISTKRITPGPKGERTVELNVANVEFRNNKPFIELH